MLKSQIHPNTPPSGGGTQIKAPDFPITSKEGTVSKTSQFSSTAQVGANNTLVAKQFTGAQTLSFNVGDSVPVGFTNITLNSDVAINSGMDNIVIIEKDSNDKVVRVGTAAIVQRA